ncbi:metallophosphoesterase family protein [soil metagenome]
MTDSTGNRYGILADVHGNLQALRAVLAFLDAEGVTGICCLGDVVGYGGDPAACVGILRQRRAVTVRGNHDQAVVDPGIRPWFNDLARRAIERQAEMLDGDDLAWLRGLPPVIAREGMTLGHGGFADPEAYVYVTDARQAATEFAAFETRCGFIGHTHVPAAWRRAQNGAVESLALGRPGRTRDSREATAAAIPLPSSSRYLINPGAVGQPRDRDPRAACAVYDPGEESFVLARLPYDIAAAQEAIRRRGLPFFEATRLAHGR